MTPGPPSSITGDAAGSGSATGSVERAFGLLQAVVAAGEPIGVRELGRRVGLPRSTVSRLVATLADLGMVERTAGRLVVPGSALATIQVPGGPAPLLRDRLRPLLTELAELHPESVALAADDGDAVRYLVQLDAASAIRAPDVHAERHPFHVAAFGLALMAFWDDDRLHRYLTRGLAAFTPNTMTDPDRVSARLERIRRDGFAWTTEEYDREVNGLATVVTDDVGQPLASIGYFGPAHRLDADRHPDLARLLVDTVAARTDPLTGTRSATDA